MIELLYMMNVHKEEGISWNFLGLELGFLVSVVSLVLKDKAKCGFLGLRTGNCRIISWYYA